MTIREHRQRRIRMLRRINQLEDTRRGIYYHHQKGVKRKKPLPSLQDEIVFIIAVALTVLVLYVTA